MWATGITTPTRHQAVSNSGVVGQKLTFFILIQNDSRPLRQLQGEALGWLHQRLRVRYYDAANNDVTGKVNAGTFTTPGCRPGSESTSCAPRSRSAPWRRRARTQVGSITVQLRGQWTDPEDAVRFTAALAPGCPDITVSPGDTIDTDQYLFDFGAVPGGTQLFTIKNEGTGPSDVLVLFEQRLEYLRSRKRHLY